MTQPLFGGSSIRFRLMLLTFAISLPAIATFIWLVLHRLASQNVSLALTLTVDVVVATITILLALRISAAITGPIEALASTARRLASGDTAVRARVFGPGEIAEVALQFNKILDNHQRHEATLRAAEAFNRSILNSVSAQIAVLDHEGVIVAVNDAWHDVANGLNQTAQVPEPGSGTGVGNNYLEVCDTGTNNSEGTRVRAGILDVLNGSLPRFSMEYPCHSPLQERWFSLSVTPFPGERPGAVLIHTDITARMQSEKALELVVAEKVALLNEVHHRVKNNLQVVVSLLRLEAGRSSQQETKSVLLEMQGRIRSMALLHDALYRSTTFSAVDLGTYLGQLATQIFRTQLANLAKVNLVLELATVNVAMDQAMPCGLLINELISNCLKHGFPDGRSGQVRIVLAHLPALGTLLLQVCDDGVGLPPDLALRREKSLGLQLVSDLTRQLGGTLDIHSGPGSTFSVTFPILP